MNRSVLPRLGAAMGLLALLSACQEDGAPRPVHLDKGVYQGAADTPLTPEQVRALQQRTARQRV
ncbi:hypothetical protein [Azospirillum picis]|uniref:Lipoprotein n=1 Tax=Azospirillum picis TaxID=488438 RepID=A0ABU0MF21_9PROT|nr:hypothetical protein [Azospirillum picis]MBP2298199.1 hypothetical protein [Azospirillum picis]MDQ0532037.1 hypothetical protein [Azospirillum picis]